MTFHIDDYDAKILQHLQSNGRLNNHELAELIGLSPSQCSRRRIALEQKGMIVGYFAQLHPDAEQPIMGMIEIKLSHYNAQIMRTFLNFVEQQQCIRDVYKLTGNYDYMLKVAVQDLAQMSDLINQLAALDIQMTNLNTSIVLERIKENQQMINVGDHVE